MIELPPGRPRLEDDDLNRLVRQQGLGWSIARCLMIDQIAKSVPLDDEESDRLIAQFYQQRQLNDAASQGAYLALEGITEADLIWRATTARRIEIFRQRQHASDVESLYLERKLQLDQVIYSLIRVRNADLAAELHQQIQEGEADFGSLAMQFSLGQERFSRGVIGPVPLASAHPDLMHRLRSGEPGQLWDPFFVVDVWLLVRLEQRLPAQLDASLRQQLEQELFERWLEERTRSFLSGADLPPLPSAAV